jgi:ABC-type transport system involved in multi-copper enzyme maturation permease subunit
MSIALTGAMAAVFGGVTFAYERRERWADFLAMMPTPRTYSILSKSALPLAVLVPIWAFNIFAAHWLNEVEPPGVNEVNLLISSAGPMFMLFGIAWLLSSFLSSPAIAACASIGLFLASSLFYNVLCAYLYSGHPSYADKANYGLIGCGLCAIVGVISFVSGSIYYVRRIAP